ncbi:MAG: hypothetical protein QXS93_00155 [Candidatus Micrarchaeia archaeon]
MTSISVEALIGILLLIMIVAIFQASLGAVLDKQSKGITMACLEKRATSTALIATAYSYTIMHGYFNPHLTCSVGNASVCRENNVITSAEIYKRQGGGD